MGNKMKYLIFWLSIHALTAEASLYKCKTPDGKPYLDTSKRLEVSFHTEEATFMTKERLEGNIGYRMPYLIYYAIDTAEPFMQISVKYEIARLQDECQKSEKVNFIAFLNSLYVKENAFLLCKNKKFEKIKISDHPEINERLLRKRNYLSQGDHSNSELGPMEYLLRYRPQNNELMNQFPLTHPDFLLDLVDFATSEQGYFDNLHYFPFLNLKSHGSKTTLLSGLHPCQLQAKVASQNEVLEKLSETQLRVLNAPNYAESLDEVEKVLRRLSLGSKMILQNVEASNGDISQRNGLGPNNDLGAFNDLGINDAVQEGLGSVMTGLGSGEGLGSDLSVGLSHVGLSAVLHSLSQEPYFRSIGFLMLEACGTNRETAHDFGTNYYVLGLYSAKNSLWYRNLDWWAMLKKADGSTKVLLDILKEETSKIQNIVSILK